MRLATTWPRRSRSASQVTEEGGAVLICTASPKAEAAGAKAWAVSETTSERSSARHCKLNAPASSLASSSRSVTRRSSLPASETMMPEA